MVQKLSSHYGNIFINKLGTNTLDFSCAKCKCFSLTDALPSLVLTDPSISRGSRNDPILIEEFVHAVEWGEVVRQCSGRFTAVARLPSDVCSEKPVVCVSVK